jgi:hypothetical protein
MCNNGLHFSRYCIAPASACANDISSHVILWLHMAQSGLATPSFITYLSCDMERAVQFIKDFTTFMHV